MSDATKSLERALKHLEKHAGEDTAKGAKKGPKGKGGPAPVDRTLVRELLLTLGELLGEPDVDLSESLQRARSAIAKLGERWTTPLTTEMQLACGEHIQGIDPRYLSHPRYDFEYALGARERLERRLQAVEALGGSVEAQLLERVAEADELLAEALEKPSEG